MKKAISLILVLMMCLSLCACGKSRSAMLNEAKTLNWSAAHKVLRSNGAKFDLEYAGKAWKYTGTVLRVYSSYCDMASEKYNGSFVNTLTVCMDTEDLAKISPGNMITVVGIMDKNRARLTDAFLVEN